MAFATPSTRLQAALRSEPFRTEFKDFVDKSITQEHTRLEGAPDLAALNRIQGRLTVYRELLKLL